MFSGISRTETKIAVLEERLTSYEVMMKKIDEAIQIMGKTSQNISKMLAVHEEKLDQTVKSDSLIVNMINEMKSENKEEHDLVHDKLKEVEKKIEDVTKFRWIFVGGLILASFLFSNSSIFLDVLTPGPDSGRIERSK
jgi:hypothetical protein